MRLPLTRFLAGPAAVLLLSATTPALAAAQASLHVSCAPQTDAAFCKALVLAAKDSWPHLTIVTAHQTPPDTATLRFVAGDTTSDDLTGHLFWRNPSGAQGQSPVLSLTVLDADPGPDAYAQFARDLIRTSAASL